MLDSPEPAKHRSDAPQFGRSHSSTCRSLSASPRPSSATPVASFETRPPGVIATAGAPAGPMSSYSMPIPSSSIRAIARLDVHARGLRGAGDFEAAEPVVALDRRALHLARVLWRVTVHRMDEPPVVPDHHVRRLP